MFKMKKRENIVTLYLFFGKIGFSANITIHKIIVVGLTMCERYFTWETVRISHR